MARSFRVVTSCSPAGWELYGLRMAETFCTYWPSTVPLSLYAEGFAPPPWINADVRSLPAWQEAFKERHHGTRAAHGMAGGRGYNFKFDAVKFSHKVGAVVDVVERADCDVLIWIDGDTVFHSEVTPEFIEGLMPEDCALAWLDRVGNYPECGFYCLNLRHHALKSLILRWKALYTSDQIFDLSEWHDCYSLQQCVEAAGVPVHSLSGEARNTSHVAINSQIGSILDHTKGGRKTEGRSRASDLKVQRKEAYWA